MLRLRMHYPFVLFDYCSCYYYCLFFSCDWEDEYELEDGTQSGSYAGNHHGRIPVVLVTVLSLVRTTIANSRDTLITSARTF